MVALAISGFNWCIRWPTRLVRRIQRAFQSDLTAEQQEKAHEDWQIW